MSQKQIQEYKVKLDQKIEQNQYGQVYDGINDSNGETVAVTIIKRSTLQSNKSLKKALSRQIKISQKINSQNILKMHGIIKDNDNYYLIQQKWDSCLSELMLAKKILYSQANLYLFQMIQGFFSLVQMDMVHRQIYIQQRNIAPTSIVIKQNKIKIRNFGFSKTIKDIQTKKYEMVGNPIYFPIEFLKGMPYTFKCDIWSVGLIYYKMLHYKLPWSGKGLYNLIINIEKQPLYIDDKLSQQSKDFLRRCLAIYEDDRISWDQILVHPIFKGFTFKQLELQKVQKS